MILLCSGKDGFMTCSWPLSSRSYDIMREGKHKLCNTRATAVKFLKHLSASFTAPPPPLHTMLGIVSLRLLTAIKVVFSLLPVSRQDSETQKEPAVTRSSSYELLHVCLWCHCDFVDWIKEINKFFCLRWTWRFNVYLKLPAGCKLEPIYIM